MPKKKKKIYILNNRNPNGWSDVQARGRMYRKGQKKVKVIKISVTSKKMDKFFKNRKKHLNKILKKHNDQLIHEALSAISVETKK